MPGSVSNAVATDVLPFSLCTAFAQDRTYSLNENIYRNGESQRGLLAATSRKRWRQTKKLTAAELEELREFYEDRNGPWEAFLFYDVFETSPKFSYDETGVAATGRYKVHFENPWKQVMGIARGEASLVLVEVA